ncbi:hypothetical protein IW261DRAFT_1470634 [Armillaria novae-zelandiae]|uniref:CXC domain-containing protein n=1 Tax=Armillaria novae-zelandiae TaxID=153914 RepID=A0AA39PC21_9AGAR|nr:hypothetical protein IW261DRAFT_1470634 [Armillaria novae-zelandiae]
MRLSHDSGLIWDTFQRDMPDIPCYLGENDLLNEINRFRPQFCPNMNCIHLDLVLVEYPPIYPVTPTKTNQSLKLQQGVPCGPDCYRHLDESQDGMMEGVQWTDTEDEEFLQGVLKLDPDISPCALAVICRKRCFEVYIYRTRAIPDEKVIIGRAGRTSRANVDFIPPCGHPGPCDANSNCQCYFKSHHCQRNCRCGVTCESFNISKLFPELSM